MVAHAPAIGKALGAKTSDQVRYNHQCRSRDRADGTCDILVEGALIAPEIEAPDAALVDDGGMIVIRRPVVFEKMQQGYVVQIQTGSKPQKAISALI